MNQGLTSSWLLVFVGGGIGSVLRYGIGLLLPATVAGRPFPVGILLANVCASALLGFVAAAVLNRMVSNDLRLLVGVGVCGGLSTFSSFSVDTLVLLQHGRIGTALLNIFLNVGLCLAASLLGFMSAGRI